MFLDTKKQWGQALVGLCGMIFPMLCILLRPKRFMSVIVVSTIILINVIAWLLSSVALVADRLCVCWENEDIVAVTQSLRGAESSMFFICLIAIIVNVYTLFKRKTICRIMSFF